MTILYVGAICEGKGLLVLLEAARLLRSRKHAFTIELMGGDESAEIKQVALEKIRRDGTSDVVRFLGVLTGNAKLEALLLDPALRKSMGTKGREVFEREFTLEKFHANLVDMFASL